MREDAWVGRHEFFVVGVVYKLDGSVYWTNLPNWLCTVYPKKYAHGFVVLCFVVVMQSFIMNLHKVFIHIHQGCFADTGAIVRLPQCQWSKPDGYGKTSQCITTTKHSKAKTVCIFLGIYCTHMEVAPLYHTFLRSTNKSHSVNQALGPDIERLLRGDMITLNLSNSYVLICNNGFAMKTSNLNYMYIVPAKQISIYAIFMLYTEAINSTINGYDPWWLLSEYTHTIEKVATLCNSVSGVHMKHS